MSCLGLLSSLFYAGLNFKVRWQGLLGSGTKGEKISYDGQDHRGFYLCVVTESLPMDSTHIHFVLRSSAFLPAAFIFSLVSFVPINTTFSVWPLISHQRICSAFPSFQLFSLTNIWSCVGLSSTKNHHIKAEHRQTDQRGERVCWRVVCRVSLLWVYSWITKEAQPVETSCSLEVIKSQCAKCR